LLTNIEEEFETHGIFNHHPKQIPKEKKTVNKLPRQPIQPKKSNYSCLKMIPQILFASILIVVTLICIFDYSMIIKMFKTFTEWVKLHPYQSIGYSIYVIAFSVVLTIPIFYTIVMLGLTYSQVFDSKMYGFLFSVPIVFSGTVIGGLVAFMLSRYLFKDFIKDQIANSEWASHKFNLINEILMTEGMLFVALIRLTAAPFGVMSYVFGVSNISFTDYAIGHLTYIVESSLLCFIGCSTYSAV
tara:strand:- start:434 stop:1162 length:729 start_codon:yes stop_codon:yes gene_type:complete